jgi:hypothetical protein
MKYLILVVILLSSFNVNSGIPYSVIEVTYIDGIQCVVLNNITNNGSGAGGVSCNWEKYNKENKQ